MLLFLFWFHYRYDSILGFSIGAALYTYFIVDRDSGENSKLFLSYACHRYFKHYCVWSTKSTPPNICFCCAVPEVPVSSGNVPTVVAGPIVKCLLLVYFFHSIYNLKRKGLVWNYSCQGNNENWLYTLLSPLSTILLGKQHDTLCVCVYGWMGVCICIQILHMNIYIYMGSDLSDGLT